nr:spermatogenesis-associated protein 17 isoform X2 [Paramormyrops kingsleyae]
MADLELLLLQIELIKEEFITTDRADEERRVKEDRAALRIQSWFRGTRLRSYLRHLQRKATIIQKIWRGYIARVYFRKKVKVQCFVMKMNFYNEMAVRIQKRWKGYYVRKYVHNYYARKRYLEGLTKKNEQVRRTMEEFAEMQRNEREHHQVECEEQKTCLQAQRMHFLLSTHQIPGVFNSPYRDFPHEMELQMKSIKPLLVKDIQQKRQAMDPSAPGDTFLKTRPLPPIPSKKPQGPFRDPATVLQQRYRPLEPTLRVATSITDLEEAREELRRGEWRGRIIDHAFQPFSHAHKNKKYERSIHTTSSFERLAYGTVYFREENQEKLRGKKPFKSIFTTCNVFDKFGQLYSNAGKIV